MPSPSPDQPVLFVGAAVHDTIAVVDDLPEPDERIEAEDIVRSGGGPAATAAVAATRLGIRAELATVVGDDAEGHAVLQALETEGVGLRHTEVRRGSTTAQCVAVVSQNGGTRCLMVQPGPAVAEIPAGYDWVHADHSGYRAAAAARQTFDRLSVDDGNPVDDLDLSLVDLYAPTLPVLYRRTGADSVESALDTAHSLGARLSVATLGSAGAVLKDAGAPPVRVPALGHDRLISTLGAGDVFHGALLAGVAFGRSAADATRLASVCAGLSCRAVDGRGALPNLSEADTYLPVLDTTESRTREPA